MAKIGDIETALKEVFGEKAFLTEEEIKNQEGIAEVIAKQKNHAAAKKHLGGRVQILRILVHKYFRFKQMAENLSEWEYNLRCEKYIDNVLVQKKYKIENIIDKFRECTEGKV